MRYEGVVCFFGCLLDVFCFEHLQNKTDVSERTTPPKKCRKIPQNNDRVTKQSVFFRGCPAIYPSARAVKALLLVDRTVGTWKPIVGGTWVVNEIQ